MQETILKNGRQYPSHPVLIYTVFLLQPLVICHSCSSGWLIAKTKNSTITTVPTWESTVLVSRHILRTDVRNLLLYFSCKNRGFWTVLNLSKECNSPVIKSVTIDTYYTGRQKQIKQQQLFLRRNNVPMNKKCKGQCWTSFSFVCYC